MPFTGDSFAHLFDWEKDPQRVEKIINARLEAEFDGVDTGLSAVAARTAVLEGRARREVITSARDYYVNASTGSDGNSGATSGTAFLTIQKFVDVAAALDLSIYDVQGNLAAGTYAGAQFKTTVGNGQVTLLGDETTPSNVVVSQSSGGSALGSASSAVPFFGIYNVRGLKITTSGGSRSCILAPNAGAIIQFKKCDFGAASEHHLIAVYKGFIQCLDNYSISAAMSGWHAAAAYGGAINLQGKGAATTVTISGTPAWGGGFALATVHSMIRADNLTFSGAATGKRYHSDGNSSINTGGGGANYFPGNVAGTTTADQEYV